MKCPHCKEIVYSYERECPFCGSPLIQEKKRFLSEDEKIILDYEKYFSWCLKIPIIVSTCFAILIFAEGLILSFTVSPICLLLWLLMPIAWLIYFLQKMYLSPTVLTIKYLKKITSLNSFTEPDTTVASSPKDIQ